MPFLKLSYVGRNDRSLLIILRCRAAAFTLRFLILVQFSYYRTFDNTVYNIAVVSLQQHVLTSASLLDFSFIARRVVMAIARPYRPRLGSCSWLFQASHAGPILNSYQVQLQQLHLAATASAARICTRSHRRTSSNRRGWLHFTQFCVLLN